MGLLNFDYSGTCMCNWDESFYYLPQEIVNLNTIKSHSLIFFKRGVPHLIWIKFLFSNDSVLLLKNYCSQWIKIFSRFHLGYGNTNILPLEFSKSVFSLHLFPWVLFEQMPSMFHPVVPCVMLYMLHMIRVPDSEIGIETTCGCKFSLHCI